MRFPWTGLLCATALTACSILSLAHAEAVTAKAVTQHYAASAAAMFGDAAAAGHDLQKAVAALVAAPSEASLAAARAAWVEARPWYMQTEGFRFGNPLVDAWEGRVNAWPLDEGLIDYVDTASYGEESEENALFTANVIANPSLTIGTETIDAGTITPELVRSLHEAAGSEANVATGYHAIEFLLWGQDLNGTGPGAGNRPFTDFDTANCTGGHCDRRAAYLTAVTALLVADLDEMAASWNEGGAARQDYLARNDKEALSRILTGLGSLSYGELAGERMKLGLLLHDPEEEQDCFSDNTHNSHYHDVAGMWAIYSGSVPRRDGTVMQGPGIEELAAVAAPAAGAKLTADMQATLAAFRALKDKADSGAMAYDQMIAAGNDEGNALVQAAIDSLITQTRGIEALVAAMQLSIKVEGSDSLDSPSAVAPQ
ncbi:peptidase [Aestuariivirga litoralis]|uniref:Peptidase n=1 Tax=Aestuariivirga litoralis TaxID=2650924 RepID=A0A2W2BHE4_9HYPH|nr:imelysin family protein [Aestuariivirga litoralis]PZF75337.1 peptidase [Aestuariivirga litoralis]